MILAALLGIGAAAFIPATSPQEPISVSLQLKVELAEPTLELVRAETERIFARAGVVFQWLGPGVPAVASVLVARKPARLMVRGCRRGLHDHRLGFTVMAHREVTLWTEQVARAASGIWDANRTPRVSDRELGRALGRALAHELGHVLLGQGNHSRRGLMREAFSHRELVARQIGAFRLSTEEIQKLKARADVPASNP